MTERDQYRSRVSNSQSASGLNTDVLEAILDTRLPRKNKADYEPYSMLVWELGKLGISNSETLESLILRRVNHALSEDQKIANKPSGNDSTHQNVSDNVFFSHTGLLNMMLEAEFGIGFHSKIFDRVEDELSIEVGSGTKVN